MKGVADNFDEGGGDHDHFSAIVNTFVSGHQETFFLRYYGGSGRRVDQLMK